MSVAFRAFELNPTMPRRGLPREEYLRARFGSVAAYKQMSGHLPGAAASEGIPFALDRIEWMPNTRDAHRLAWLAATLGVQQAVVSAIFSAFFAAGRDIGDPDVLREIAVANGIERARASALLASDEGLAEVLAQEERAHRLGIDGVPAFLLNGEPVLSGAQPPRVIAAAILSAVGA